MWDNKRGVHIVAVAAMIFREGRVLAMRRALNNPAGPGLWETLSGRVEQGEEPIDAVAREIAEECGVSVQVDPRPYTVYTALRNSKPMMLVLYRARYAGGEVTLSHEHDEYAWLTPEEFATRSTLAKLVNVVRAAALDPWLNP